jgi:hypothetical protein
MERSFDQKNLIGGFVGGTLGILAFGGLGMIACMLATVCGFFAGFYHKGLWSLVVLSLQQARKADPIACLRTVPLMLLNLFQRIRAKVTSVKMSDQAKLWNAHCFVGWLMFFIACGLWAVVMVALTVSEQSFIDPFGADVLLLTFGLGHVLVQSLANLMVFDGAFAIDEDQPKKAIYPPPEICSWRLNEMSRLGFWAYSARLLVRVMQFDLRVAGALLWFELVCAPAFILSICITIPSITCVLIARGLPALSNGRHYVGMTVTLLITVATAHFAAPLVSGRELYLLALSNGTVCGLSAYGIGGMAGVLSERVSWIKKLSTTRPQDVSTGVYGPMMGFLEWTLRPFESRTQDRRENNFGI